jgi:hypothetical protein
MISVQSVFDLEELDEQKYVCMSWADTTHIPWIFCDAIANALLEALQILVEEALVFDEHERR